MNHSEQIQDIISTLLHVAELNNKPFDLEDIEKMFYQSLAEHSIDEESLKAAASFAFAECLNKIKDIKDEKIIWVD